MKLVRYGDAGKEKPGIIDQQGRLRGLSGLVSDITPQTLSPELLDKIRRTDTASLPEVAGTPRIGACVARPSKIIGVGLNFKDHIKESGAPTPTEPVLFIKTPNTIAGPNDPVVIPKRSQRTDWEVELAVVIGKKARHVSPEEALNYVAGYTVANDVSERDDQLKNGQWTPGKCVDGFLPLGPHLVTTDEVPNPQNLELHCDVNGTRRQTGNTADMLFTVPQLISYISSKMTLEPGDVIITGTPPGVGLGAENKLKAQKAQYDPKDIYLKHDDKVTLGISGLGQQEQTFVAERLQQDAGAQRAAGAGR